MAALFQIRRGVSGSLSNGELYYNQTTQSLQLGTDTNSVITLAKLNETNSGNFDITGDLIVSGNANIVGNLTFGDSSGMDTVTVVASLSSSLIPQSDNSFDLGSDSKQWETLYVNTVSASVLSGSFAGVGNLQDFSASVSQSIGHLNNFSASQYIDDSSSFARRTDLLETAMNGSNRLYVSPNGSDDNDGTEPHKPFKTIKGAVESLGDGIASNIKRYTIFVGSGNYTENNPIVVPPGVSIVGDTLRNVRLTAANPKNDFFHVHDSNYFYGLRFLGLQSPSFAFSFPCSTATATIYSGEIIDLEMIYTADGYVHNESVNVIIEGPDNVNGRIATATANVDINGTLTISINDNGSLYNDGEKPHVSIQAPTTKRPVITTSPYIQNCSSITGPFDISGNGPLYRALPYSTTDIDEQGAGGGIRIDGNLVGVTSPLESFVADAFTQVNQGGPGHLVINKGYAQFVSCFTTFCTYGFKVANGGFANISNSVIDFGKYGLISKKYFPTTYNTATSLETKTSVVSGFVIDENGAGYTGSIAGVTITGGGASLQATAQATVNSNGSIDEIVLLTSGSGYTFEPTVTIAPPTGPGAIQATTIGNKAKISGVTGILINLSSGLRGVDISSNMVLNGINYLVTNVAPGSNTNERRVTTYPAPPSIQSGNSLNFYPLSNISTGGLVMEYVGSGVTYNALPKYGGVPDRTKEINQILPGRVFYTTVDNIGNLKIGDFFAVNQLTGEVTINANSFNLSGLNAIGPFKRNGVAVGVVLEEVSNNTTLLNAEGNYGETTVPTQYAVKGYIDPISSSFANRVNKLELTGSNHESRVHNLELISASYNAYTQSTNQFTASVTQSLDAIHSYTASLKTALTASGQNVTIYGNLTVQGTQTAIESTTLNVKDINITLASGSTNSAAANGAGINIDGANVTMSWSDTNQRIQLNKDFAVTGSISSSTLVGVGNVTLFSASVSASIGNLNNTSASLYNFSASQYNSDSSSFNTRITANSASAWGAFQSASSYSGSLATSISASNATATSYSRSLAFSISASKAEYTSFSASSYTRDANQDTNTTQASASAWGAFQSASTYSGSFYTTINNTTSSVANISTSVGLLQQFSGSEYKNDSSSFSTRISASTLTFNDTTGQTGIDFTKVGTQVSAIASGLTTTSNVQFNNVTASTNISASGTITCDTLVATTLVGATLPVLQYTTQGTLGNILIKGDASKSIHVVDTITFTGITENIGNSSQATGLLMTGSITASAGFSGSINGIGNVTSYSSSVASNILINSQSAWGAFQSASSYSSSLVTSISASKAEYTSYSASAVAIFATTGSNTFNGSQNIKGDITASGNLYVSGTIYTYELHTIIESSSIIRTSGSTFIGDQQSDVLTITGSLYQTGSTTFSELTGSLFDFSASLNSRIGTTNVGTLSASIYQTDATQSNNITIVSASAWGAFQSASSYSGSFYTTLNTMAGNITTAQNSANGAYASASAYSASSYTRDANQDTNTTQASASAWGAFQSASSYSSSFYTTINTVIGNVTTAQNSANGAYASASAYSSSAFTAYAKVGAANTFTQNQIISGSLSVTGDVTAYATSDERLKDNIQLISNPIQKVEQLRGVEFDWKDGMPKAGQHDYGVIAQDVIKVLPELVNQRPDGYYAVEYDKIIGLLIEVVKEQEKRIKDLENKVGS